MKVWVITSQFTASVERVFKTKKLAQVWLKNNELSKFVGFYAKSKRDVDDCYCYTLGKYEVEQ